MENYLTVRDLSERLHISRTKATALMQSEGFPSVRFGRPYLVLEESFRQWWKENEGKSIKLLEKP